MRVKAIASKTDHPLSRAGYLQARALQTSLRRAMRRQQAAAPTGDELDAADELSTKAADGSELGSLVALLLSAGALWASPFARCVQTALVALQPLRSRAGALAIELKPNARERREMTKLSSIGNCHGERIVSRCVEKLREVRPDDEASTSGARKEAEAAAVDTAEVESQWWSGSAEGDREYAERLRELLAQVQYSSHDSIVIVGHGELFQQLLADHAHPAVRERQPGAIDALLSEPIAHCAVVWCCLDFQRGAARPITDVAVMSDYLEETMGGRGRRASSAADPLGTPAASRGATPSPQTTPNTPRA